MRLLTFSKRTAKEILRDPLTVLFGLGFPLVVLLLLSVIQSNIPTDLFKIEHLAPGIAVFGLSFMTLFSATLVAKDRETAFLQRLYTTPLTSADCIFGYILPVLPIAVIQTVICFLAAVCLGLTVSVNLVLALVTNIPVILFYVSLGLLCGSVFNVKQVGGVCGALLTNLSAWLSGVWFDLELVGGTFKKIAYCFPFVHSVELQRAVMAGDFHDILPHLAVVLCYTVVVTLLAIVLFLRQKNRQ